MQIIFINPPFKSEYGKFSRESRSPAITKSGALYYPLWLIYAAAWCEKCGHKVGFIDATAFPLSEEETLSKINELAEKTEKIMFVLDTSTPSIKSDIEFGAKLKDEFINSFVILVGTHPSAVPEETLNFNTKIDAVAIGEFDHTVEKLASALESDGNLENVNGIMFRKPDGSLYRTLPAEYITDLDSIPYASQFIKKYLNEKQYFFPAAAYPEIQIFTGRGCPCRCNFCVYPQTMHGHKYRARSPENVVGEFKYIAENFEDVKEVVIEDDTFTADKNRVKEICNLLISRKLNKKLRWLCNARVNTLDLETMKLMKKAGCRLIIPGIESGSQQILNNIKKGTKVEQFYSYTRNAKKAGLKIHACYMVGNEGETKETMQETLKLALKLNTDTAQFFPLIPYPGTEAYDWAVRNKFITVNYEDYVNEDGTHNTVLNEDGLSSKEMVDFCNYARKKYYLRPGYIMHRIISGLTDFEDLKRSLKAFGKLWKYLIK